MATIGTIGWKGKGFRALVNYIYSDKGKMNNDTSFPPIYRHVFEPNPEAVIKAFQRIEKTRRIKRKDSIKVFHEFVSFHPDDKPSVSILEDLAEKYIELRLQGRSAVVFARAHFTKARHIHFAVSGVDMDGKSMTLNNKDFMRIRRDFESYQISKYPKLKSIVYLDKEKHKTRSQIQADRNKRSQLLYRYKLRSKKISKKEMLFDTFAKAANESRHFQDLTTKLKSKGIAFYYAKRKLMGLNYGKKNYRFKTLGIDIRSIRLIALEQENHRLYESRKHELLKARKNHSQDRERE